MQAVWNFFGYRSCQSSHSYRIFHIGPPWAMRWHFSKSNWNLRYYFKISSHFIGLSSKVITLEGLLQSLSQSKKTRVGIIHLQSLTQSKKIVFGTSYTCTKWQYEWFLAISICRSHTLQPYDAHYIRSDNDGGKNEITHQVSNVYMYINFPIRKPD